MPLSESTKLKKNSADELVFDIALEICYKTLESQLKYVLEPFVLK